MEKTIVVQEEKYVKRIGYITHLNDAILKSLPEWEKWFDVKRISLAERFEFFRSIPGLIERQEIFENITPTVGFTQIVKAMTGNLASLDDIKVNLHALGTGSATPVAGDTTLDNEGYRKLLTSWSYSGTKAVYTIFYNNAEAIGTWSEMGLFIKGNPAIPDDGILWDRSLASITKTGSQNLTLDYEDTFVNG